MCVKYTVLTYDQMSFDLCKHHVTTTLVEIKVISTTPRSYIMPP